MESAIAIVFQIGILIFSVVIHEVSHGLAANALGDPTAKYAGRLTLNPLKHLDPVGSILIPLASFLLGGIVIGWAKPVPYNPNQLQIANRELGAAIVGAAGPLANISVAVLSGTLLRIISAEGLPAGGEALITILSVITIINISLAVFNLVPIPPLDGSKVLFSLFPGAFEGLRFFLERFGFFILLLFIFYFSGWLAPIIRFLFQLITGFRA